MGLQCLPAHVCLGSGGDTISACWGGVAPYPLPMSCAPLCSQTVRRTAARLGRYVWIFLGLLLSGGCNYHKVTVVSRASPNVPIGSYSLQVTGSSDRALREQVAAVMKGALGERGYLEAQVGGAPYMLVEVDFGRTTETRNSFTYSNPNYSFKSERDGGRDQVIMGEPVVSAGRVTVSLNTLLVTANRFDPRTGRSTGPSIWSVDVRGGTRGDKTPDLRAEAPILMAASLKYLGTTSGGTRTVFVDGVRAAQNLTVAR